MPCITRWRSRIRIAAISLMLGAGITVCVAWSCAWRLNPDRMIARPLHDADRDGEFADVMLEHLRIIRDQHASDDQIIVCEQKAFGALRRVAVVVPYWHATTAMTHEVGFHTSTTPPLLMRVHAGWPWQALAGRQRLSGMTADRSRYTFEREWMIGMRRSHDVETRAVPFKPLWVGFGMNTTIYAGMAWLMIGVPHELRRARRRRSGLCEQCAYPRGSSTICSECGETLTMHQAQSHTP